jgi:hypothetical protein
VGGSGVLITIEGAEFAIEVDRIAIDGQNSQ